MRAIRGLAQADVDSMSRYALAPLRGLRAWATGRHERPYVRVNTQEEQHGAGECKEEGQQACVSVHEEPFDHVSDEVHERLSASFSYYDRGQILHASYAAPCMQGVTQQIVCVLFVC